MSLLKYTPVLFCYLLIVIAPSCNKSKSNATLVPRAKERDILYLVKGSNFRLNFIDSNSVFQRDKVFQDSFRYEFKKGSGASIGISIYKQSPGDSIHEWEIYIDGQLTANAFSEGGAYLTVPYY